MVNTFFIVLVGVIVVVGQIVLLMIAGISFIDKKYVRAGLLAFTVMLLFALTTTYAYHLTMGL